MSVRIVDICGNRGFFRKGDRIKAIDGKNIEDQLDLYYLLSGTDSAIFTLERDDGRTVERRIRIETFERAGPIFEEMRFIRCGSRCIFCFVDQMPAGMRESLYFKDDDYRLSFLFGNYITLNDITGKQIKRIIEHNLSPLYVSVHATDRGIRSKIFGRPMRNDIMAVLNELADGGISIHAQVVVIPGMNDGSVLADTIRDLFKLYPACRTLAVVPVGLTRHRDGLTRLRKVSATEAREMIDLAGEINSSILDETEGSDFVFMSDEFYLLADRTFPDAKRYGGFEQLSNGVGMSRLFIDGLRDRVDLLKRRKVPPAGKMTLITGRLGSRLMKRHVLPIVKGALPGLSIKLIKVDNSTFGRSVGVSGLLSGTDILAAVRRKGGPNGILVLPPNSVNHDGMLIDDTRPSGLGKELGTKVLVPRVDFLEDRILRACRRSIV
jgi:putative radical SAM enzyme (TIGR03279 family)